MPDHPLVEQLRFTRKEFFRAIRGVNDDDARRRLLPMNCISWNVGHLAWQEQRYFLGYPTGDVLYPEIAEHFASGAPASTPALPAVVNAWRDIIKAADGTLERWSPSDLAAKVVSKGKAINRTYGNLVQRVIYHYWYHTGENMAIRQQLGHSRLPQFVGNIDDAAPFRPG
ncbi:MAG TPA: DinB family protein [Acidimicrobiia bacterium]|nr:DinB family protein [Acidimicrobiia bacterium]